MLGYTYDRLGDMMTQLLGGPYPYGHTRSFAYDNAGRLVTVTSTVNDSTHPPTLYTGAVYNAGGQLSSALLGNGIAEIRTYDNRLRVTSITAGSAYSVSVNYAPNGDILSSNDSVNGHFTYTYDDFNRMISAFSPADSRNTGCGEVYDRYGNRWQQTAYSGIDCWTEPSVSFSQNNNRIDGFSYDAAGNLLGRQSHTYTYDPENRITAIDGGSLSQYAYDAEGRRVTNSNWSVPNPSEYIYDLENRELDMLWFDGYAGWPTRTYIYAGDRHLATYFQSETAFNHTDWLGTMRLATAHDGSIFQNSLNANPWGEELYYPNSQGDASLLHFTDKEEDSEDGLVYFGGRYYDPYQPRFMTADWAEKPEAVPYADLSDPQSLNLYAYVRNNPVSRSDADGHDGVVSNLSDTFRKIYQVEKAAIQTDARVVEHAMSHIAGEVTSGVAEMYAGAKSDNGHLFMKGVNKVGPIAAMAVAPEAGPVAGEEAGAEGSILENAAKGKAFQNQLAADVAATDSKVAQNVMLKTKSGTRTVMDVVSTDNSGNVALREAKSSATAGLTKNQRLAHPEIGESGAVVVGKGKPGYPGGTQIPPTPVQVVRPKDPGGF